MRNFKTPTSKILALLLAGVTAGAPLAANADTYQLRIAAKGVRLAPSSGGGNEQPGPDPATGQLPAVVSPSSLSFGPVEFGASSPAQVLTISNPNSTAMALGGSSVTLGSASFTVVGSNCGSSIPSNSSCTVEVAMAPDSYGSQLGELMLLLEGAARTVPLSGAATADILTMSPAALEFSAAQGGSSSATLTIENIGPLPTNLALSALNPPFARSGGTCAATLANNSSCTAIITFSPVSVDPEVRFLGVGGSDGVVAKTVQLSGAVLSGPTLSVSTTSEDFGTVTAGSTQTKTITVTNSGGTSTTLSYTGLAAPITKTGGTCGASLAANSSCTVIVSFAPVSEGSATKTLTITGSAGVAAQAITFTGMGAMANLSVSVPSYNFGTIALGKTITGTITVSNTGTASASFLTFSGVTAPFTRTGGTCGGTLAANASCTAIITFQPSSAVTSTKNMTVSAQGLTSKTVVLSGTGAIGVLEVSPTSWDAGPKTLSSSTTKTFTVTNTGPVATDLSIDALVLPFTVMSTTCGSVLGPNSPCTISVRYMPTVAGSYSQNLTLRGGTGVATKTVPIAGQTLSTLSVSAAVSNYNVRTAYNAAFGSPSQAVHVQVTVSSGVVISSTSTSTPAFDTGLFPAGSTVTLVNNGHIVGKGGRGGQGGSRTINFTDGPGADGTAGGPALRYNTNIKITNNGGIFGGGGGGGGGPSSSCGSCSGGGGGGGAGGGEGGYILGVAGTSGATGAGGAGGTGPANTNSKGGDGGNYGMPGANGVKGISTSYGGAGGAAGAAVITNGGFTLTWTSGNTATQVKGIVQ